MDTCPICNRKLLSHASVRCNWCGAEINDESYQQQAAQERAIYRAHEAERDAIEAARSAGGSFNSNIWGNPVGAVSSLANTWAGRKRWEQARFQAQQKALQEYGATQQGGVSPMQQPPQNIQSLQGQAPTQWQPQAPVQQAPQTANQTVEEEPATPENEVRSMFRHLEL